MMALPHAMLTISSKLVDKTNFVENAGRRGRCASWGCSGWWLGPGGHADPARLRAHGAPQGGRLGRHRRVPGRPRGQPRLPGLAQLAAGAAAPGGAAAGRGPGGRPAGPSLGFLLSLSWRQVPLRLVLLLLAGGLVAAPLAAWLVKRLAPRKLGVIVGAAILVTNFRALASTFGIEGARRAASYLAIVAVVGALA